MQGVHPLCPSVSRAQMWNGGQITACARTVPVPYSVPNQSSTSAGDASTWGMRSVVRRVGEWQVGERAVHEMAVKSGRLVSCTSSG